MLLYITFLQFTRRSSVKSAVISKLLFKWITVMYSIIGIIASSYERDLKEVIKLNTDLI